MTALEVCGQLNLQIHAAVKEKAVLLSCKKKIKS